LQFDDEALHRIAKNAARERTGARGLVSAVEHVLMKFEHTLPSSNIRQLLVTGEMVDDPAGELDKILKHPDDPERELAFKHLVEDEELRLEKVIQEKVTEMEATYGIHFSGERIKLIIRHILERQTDIGEVIEEIKSFQYVIQEFTNHFNARNNLDMSFTDDALDCLAEKVWHENHDPLDYLKASFQNYDQGLKLIMAKTGNRRFLINAKGVSDPEQYLNSLIQDAYRQPC